MKSLKYLGFIFFALFACGEEEMEQPVQMISDQGIIFGEIYGECSGDCREVFLLKNDSLYRDSNQDLGGTPLPNTSFSEVPLPMSDFDSAKFLLNIPTNIPAPDDQIFVNLIADFDYFLLIRTNTLDRTWRFDEIDESAPAEIKEYFERLIEVNDQLKN